MTIEVKNDEMLGRTDNTTLHIELMKLQQENKILRENAEHNDKVVDKVNWENQLLKQRIDKAINYIEENKNKSYAPYGDNEDYDYETCLNKDEIKCLLEILKGSDKE